MKDGYIVKNFNDGEVSKEDLELINKLARRPLKSDEVYVFSLILCDNEIDREYERFTKSALQKLSELFVGKTGILDHEMKSSNQKARIFSCEVEEVKGKKNSLGEPYFRLKAKAYMPRTEQNDNFILEIDSGIKKEISVGCAVSEILCSICGENTRLSSCDHVKGKKYGERVCHYILDNPIDAYEWSFVAVPAQKEAGVVKSFSLNEKGGVRNLDEIIKSLNSGKNFNISGNQAKQLADFIENLKVEAQDGKSYKEEMRKEVIKLCLLSQPNIHGEIIDSVTKKMTLEELKDFQRAFKMKVDEILPLRPQLSSPRSTVKNKKTLKNTEFKI